MCLIPFSLSIIAKLIFQEFRIINCPMMRCWVCFAPQARPRRGSAHERAHTSCCRTSELFGSAAVFFAMRQQSRALLLPGESPLETRWFQAETSGSTFWKVAGLSQLKKCLMITDTASRCRRCYAIFVNSKNRYETRSRDRDVSD